MSWSRSITFVGQRARELGMSSELGDETVGGRQRQILPALKRVLGIRASMPVPKRRRLYFLYAFAVVMTALIPLMAPATETTAIMFNEIHWTVELALGSLALLATLRVFKAEKIIGALVCLWLGFWISFWPVVTGDAAHLPLLALICMPLIMGVISGPRACGLGTASVIAVYISVAWTSQNADLEGASGDLAMLAYAGICTIVSSLVFVFFDHSSELQTNTLREDKNRIEKEALTDALTGCANRRAFMLAMERLADAADYEQRYGLVIIDLDRFKQINDTFGHHAGDAVLSVFADRLKIIVGHDCPVYRLGGDEFAIICEGVRSEDAMQLLGEQIVSATEVPISNQGGNLEFEASVGIAIASESIADVDLLYQQADTALFAAKDVPGANFIVFDSMLDGTATRRFEITQCLKSAVDQRSIKIALQPQIYLDTGSVIGFEALARWNDPLLGKVSPSEFIPIAEQTALIEILDRQVITKALRGASGWLPRHQRIAMNVSARSLNSKDFPEFMISQINRSRILPGQVELEITETALIENWMTSKQTVEQLRSFGVRIALDDFGVGYSSLSYLTEFPIQKLKFDRSFLYKSHERSAALVMQSIIELARKMNLDLVVEGIETEDQLKLVRKLGCKVGQGYLLGRPALRGGSNKKPTVEQEAA